MSNSSPTKDVLSAQRDMPGAFPTAPRLLLPLPATHSHARPGSALVESDATAVTTPSLGQGSTKKAKRYRKKNKNVPVASVEGGTSRQLLEAARGLVSRVPNWRKPEVDNGGSSASPSVLRMPLQTNSPTTPSTSHSARSSPSEQSQSVPGIFVTPATPKKANHSAASQSHTPAMHPPHYHSPSSRASAPLRAAEVAETIALSRSTPSSVQLSASYRDESQTATSNTVSFGELEDTQMSPQTIQVPTPLRPINITQLSSGSSAAVSAAQASSPGHPYGGTASPMNMAGTPSPPPSPQPPSLDPSFNASPLPPRFTLQEEGSGWPNVAEKFGEHDGKKVREWHDELDTLLVFAGLFSAIVTAFIIEFYSALLPDSDDRREKQMTRLSEQMEQLTIYFILQDPSQVKIYPPVHFETFVPPNSAVWMNSLWFSSLLCALMAAALATLTKQWLRRYIAVDYSASRERVRLREYRYSSLVLWFVPHAIAALPVLLRIALNLFFAGLLVQLWQLDTALTSVCVIWIALWTAVYTLATVLPSAFPRCPYASPEALAFAHLTRALHRGVKGKKSFSWDEREGSCKQDPSLDIRALATAAVTFSDPFLENPVRECVQDLQPHRVPSFIAECFLHRLQSSVKGRIVWGMRSNAQLQFSKFSRRATAAFLNMLLDATERYLRSVPTKPGSHLLAINECLTDLLRYSPWQLPDDIEERVFHFFRQAMAALQPSTRHAADIVEQITSVLCARPELLVPELTFILPQLMRNAKASVKAKASVEHSLEACIVVFTLQDFSDIDSREMGQFMTAHAASIRDAALKVNINKMLPLDRTACAKLLRQCLQTITGLSSSSPSKDLRIALAALRTALDGAAPSSKTSKRSSKEL